jgi:hypothetical protein
VEVIWRGEEMEQLTLDIEGIETTIDRQTDSCRRLLKKSSRAKKH